MKQIPRRDWQPDLARSGSDCPLTAAISRSWPSLFGQLMAEYIFFGVFMDQVEILTGQAW